MPEINVEINGRKYRMACEDGQEAHLAGLAGRFNRAVEDLKARFGEIGDNRLTVMAGIAVLDELCEAERRIADLEGDVEKLTRAGEALSAELETMEAKFSQKMAETALKVEAIVNAIEETVAPATDGG